MMLGDNGAFSAVSTGLTMRTNTSGGNVWDDNQEQMFRNAIDPVIEYFKATKQSPEEEVKSLVRRLVSLSGVTRPATPKIGQKKEKKDKVKESHDKHVRFLGECCVCGLEKRGNYDRLGFLCAGCRTVPLKNVQHNDSTRVSRVRYSAHYVPSILYARKFNFLPETDPIAEADLTPAVSASDAGGLNSKDIVASINSQTLKLGAHSSASDTLSGADTPAAVNIINNSKFGKSNASPISNALSNFNVFDMSGNPGRYTVYAMNVPDHHKEQIFGAVESIRNLYHPSFLFNYAVARDQQRDKIWVVHETAQPIELRGALLKGQRCFELLRQVSVAALSGLLFLKDFNRSHNDLRPHNFFIDDQHRVKLRLAPFPVEDLPAPFSYENSFFKEAQQQQQQQQQQQHGSHLAPILSGSSFTHAVTEDYPTGGGSASNSASQVSLRKHQSSFASKIDSYCLSRRTSRRRSDNPDWRDMFVLGVTLTLIAFGDVDHLPLPHDGEASSLNESQNVGTPAPGNSQQLEGSGDINIGTAENKSNNNTNTAQSPPTPASANNNNNIPRVPQDADEMFLVEFIWRLLTGERNPDEALRDDYLTTVRQVDGCAVETIVLRVVGPQIPANVQEELTRLNIEAPPPPAEEEATTTTTTTKEGKKDKKDKKEKKLKFDETESGKREGSGQKEQLAPAKQALLDKKKKEILAALDAASVRFRVNRWTTAVAKLVSFFNNAEMPAGENESIAADPHLFQVIRTPTQLTFYSVRRDPRLLRARQIAAERQVSKEDLFNNALMASSSMTLAGNKAPSMSF